MDVLGSMQNYIWRRNDSMTGPGSSMGYLTTQSSKERMLSYMKDYFERGMMTVLSMELIEEMKTIVRDGGSIEASGRNKDDRVIATALACVAYAEQVQPRLIMNRITRSSSKALDDKTPEQIAMNRNVSDYLKHIGLHDAS
jgi:hypothetical protein